MSKRFQYLHRGIALVAMLTVIFVSASAHELRQLQVFVNLQDNGDAYVTEIRDMYIGDEGTEIYVPIGNFNGSKVELISVQDGEQKFQNIGEWDVDRSRSFKAGKCGTVYKSGGDVELCWGVGDTGDHHYVTTYLITNLVRGYSDADGFNHMFVNPNIKPLPQYVELKVFRGDIEKGRYDELPLETDSVKAWAFRFKGNVEITDNSVDVTTSEPFSSESAMIVMCRFEKGIFQPQLESESSFEEIKNRAFEGSDYGSSEMSAWDRFWEETIYYIFFALMFILPLGLYIYDRWQKRKLRKELEKDLLWHREPPYNGDLKHSQMMLSCLNYSDMTTQNLLSAYVLRMIYNGSLVIKDVRYTKSGKTDQLLAIGKPINRDDLSGNDVYLLTKMYDIFKEAAGSDQILQPKELTSYMKKNAERLETFAKRLAATTSMSKVRSEFSKMRELVGFRKFLKEFTLSNERHAKEVTLWKEYLIFATLFGCADQVKKDMKAMNPEFFSMDKISQQLDTNKVILPNYSMAVSRGTDSVNHFVSQREAAARRSSGGGGFSSWGGGGGFSGGGSGGGVR